MGNCQCEVIPSKSEAQLEKSGLIEKQSALFDLAPAPSFYLGASGQKKKHSHNSKTLNLVSSQVFIPSQGSPELEPLRVMRSPSKKKRIEKTKTRTHIFLEAIKKLEKPPDPADLEMRFEFLRKHFVFRSLSPDDL